MNILLSRAAIGAVFLLAASAGALGQNASSAPAAGDGIAVFGTGEVTAKPNQVELDLNLSGKAELTGDALVKFRDAKKRLADALDKLGIKDLVTEERGTSISAGTSIEQQQRIVNGMPQVPGKPQIEVSSTVRVCLKNVRDMPPDDLVKTIGKLIDVAQDAGITIGPSQAEILMRQRMGQYTTQNTTVRFVVSDLEAMKEKAYEAAVNDARSRAARLAKLNGVKLGSAISVQEIQVAGDHAGASAGGAAATVLPYPLNMLVGGGGATSEGGAEPRISSTTLAEIPVQVKLLVRFAIGPADPATAQK